MYHSLFFVFIQLTLLAFKCNHENQSFFCPMNDKMSNQATQLKGCGFSFAELFSLKSG